MRTLRLRVQLRDVHPAVVRVLDVPAQATLDELHLLLQVGLGWTDSHLHQFEADGTIWGVPDPDGPDPDGPPIVDERTVKLSALPSRFEYLYDFGDNWEHDVEVQGRGGDEPGCVDGEGDCPPEDCGGAHGYAQLRAVLADPTHPEHAELRAWVGDLPVFDRDHVDLLVRRVVGRVPSGVRLVLDTIAGGVTLTPAGRLPRAAVRQVQWQRPEWTRGPDEDRPAQREDDVIPLLALHDLLRAVGLLRIRRGVLAPIKAASDDHEVLRRLRGAYPEDTFHGILAVVAIARLLAEGPHRNDELAQALLPTFERFLVDGRPLERDDLRAELNRMAHELRALGQVETDLGTWRAGPEAGWLLPRTALLADLWSGPDDAGEFLAPPGPSGDG